MITYVLDYNGLYCQTFNRILETLSEMLVSIENSKKSSSIFKESCRKEADMLRESIRLIIKQKKIFK